MKRVVLSLLFVMGVMGLQAQSYEFLTFQSTTGDKSVKALGTVITFADGQMNVKNADEEFSLTLSELSKFFFSDTSAAIENISDGTDTAVSVYTVSGQFIGIFADEASANAQLPKGIYVMKGKNNSKKLMVE